MSIRKVCLALVSSAAIGLSGCATTPAGSLTTGLTLAQVVQDALIACQGICAVAPTAATITEIILAASGNAVAQLSEQTATAAANVFCKAVAGQAVVVAGKSIRPRLTAPRRLDDGTVSYGTIVINGRTIVLRGTPVS